MTHARAALREFTLGEGDLECLDKAYDYARDALFKARSPESRFNASIILVTTGYARTAKVHILLLAAMLAIFGSLLLEYSTLTGGFSRFCKSFRGHGYYVDIACSQRLINVCLPLYSQGQSPGKAKTLVAKGTLMTVALELKPSLCNTWATYSLDILIMAFLLLKRSVASSEHSSLSASSSSYQSARSPLRI